MNSPDSNGKFTYEKAGLGLCGQVIKVGNSISVSFGHCCLLEGTWWPKVTFKHFIANLWIMKIYYKFRLKKKQNCQSYLFANKSPVAFVL